MGSQTAVPPKGSPNAQPTPNPIVSFVPMIVVIGILYFLIIRPQQQQAKAHRNLVDNLKTGDRVITLGGIHGTVTSIKGVIVQVKIADNVRVDVNRTAIAQVVQESNNGSGAPALGEKSA
jgi:preprotein translocase subunit YajC